MSGENSPYRFLLIDGEVVAECHANRNNSSSEYTVFGKGNLSVMLNDTTEIAAWCENDGIRQFDKVAGLILKMADVEDF